MTKDDLKFYVARYTKRLAEALGETGFHAKRVSRQEDLFEFSNGSARYVCSKCGAPWKGPCCPLGPEVTVRRLEGRAYDAGLKRRSGKVREELVVVWEDQDGRILGRGEDRYLAFAEADAALQVAHVLAEEARLEKDRKEQMQA